MVPGTRKAANGHKTAFRSLRVQRARRQARQPLRRTATSPPRSKCPTGTWTRLSQRFFRLLGLHPGSTAGAYAAAALAGISADEAAGYLEALYGEGLLTEAGCCPTLKMPM